MLVLLRYKGAQIVSEVEHWVSELGVDWLRWILDTEGFLRLRDIRRVPSHVSLDPPSHISSTIPSKSHSFQRFPSVNLLFGHLLIPIRAAFIIDITNIVLLLLLYRRSLLTLSMRVRLGQRGWVSYRILCLGFDVDVHQLGLGAILDVFSVKLAIRKVCVVEALHVLYEPDLRFRQGPQSFFLPGSAACVD